MARHRILARRVAGLVLCGGALAGAPAADATPIPVSATLSHPIQDGWATIPCGPLGLYRCIRPTVDHTLTILLSDGSSVAFDAAPELAQILASLVPLRLDFDEVTSAGGTLDALRGDFSAYSRTAYDLYFLPSGDTIYDEDLNPVEPAHYRYTDPDGAVHLLVGDGTGSFFNPVPEPGTLLLVAAGLATVVATRPSPRTRYVAGTGSGRAGSRSGCRSARSRRSC